MWNLSFAQEYFKIMSSVRNRMVNHAYSTQGHSLSQKQANGFLVINKTKNIFNLLQDLLSKQKDKSQFDSGLKQKDRREQDWHICAKQNSCTSNSTYFFYR